MVRAVTVDVFHLTGVSFLVKEERAKTESVEKLKTLRLEVLEKNLEGSSAPMRACDGAWLTPTPGQCRDQAPCEGEVQSLVRRKGGADNTDGAGC